MRNSKICMPVLKIYIRLVAEMGSTVAIIPFFKLLVLMTVKTKMSTTMKMDKEKLDLRLVNLIE